MKSPKDCQSDKCRASFVNKRSAAFTLIEVLVVLGMLALALGAGLGIGINTFRRQAFDVERDTATQLLLKARNQSMNNIGQEPHGVHIDDTDGYTLFQGASYDSSDPANQSFPKSAIVTVSPEPFTVVFEQLSGRVPPAQCTNDPCQSTLTSDTKSVTITINEEGRITWEII